MVSYVVFCVGVVPQVLIPFYGAFDGTKGREVRDWGRVLGRWMLGV